MLTPVVGDRYAKKFTPLLDGICLFCLCAGMAGTLGSGILVVSGGVEALSGGAFEIDLRMWIIIGVLIVACFIISAASGLNRGIKHLSAVNSYFYLALGIIVFLAGPTAYLLNLCSESFGAYLSDFFRLSLWTSGIHRGWLGPVLADFLLVHVPGLDARLRRFSGADIQGLHGAGGPECAVHYSLSVQRDLDGAVFRFGRLLRTARRKSDPGRGDAGNRLGRLRGAGTDAPWR